MLVRLAIAALLVTAVIGVPAIHDEATFEGFMIKHNKVYQTEEETALRRSIFEANVAKAAYVNSLHKDAEYGITKFMDLSEEEFKAQYLGMKSAGPMPYQCPATASPAPGQLPDSFDWREHGAVTAVKNQGQCGSCWAFSATEDVEGSWFLAKNESVNLSEQELVDCDDNGDHGCEGGLPGQAFEWIIKKGGMEADSDYPYTAMDGQCKFDASKVKAKISKWTCVDTDEDKIARYLMTAGPLSIGINAQWMQFYIGGVADPLWCPDHLDHGVLIVGFATKGDKPYWIIKNSWGSGWGNSGYYHIARGKSKCGLNQMVTHSIV